MTALESLQHLQASQRQARAQFSQQHCEQGFACLAMALEATTLKTQKPFLLEACNAFAEGIRFQRTNPEAYIGFAYVLLAIGNPSKAMRYVKEAQRLQPEHPDILPLLETLQRKSKSTAPVRAGVQTLARPTSTQAPLAGSGPSKSVTLSEPEYDELYDSLEIELMAEVKIWLSGLGTPPQPSRNPRQLKKLQQEQQELKTRIGYFESQFKLLDQEIDISELQTKAKPLYQTLKRLENCVEVCQLLAALCQEIEAQETLANQVLAETVETQDPEDLSIIEENLEALLDQADLFADQLEALENQGYQLAEGLKAYESLVKAVEDLEDALEDFKERLNST